MPTTKKTQKLGEEKHSFFSPPFFCLNRPQFQWWRNIFRNAKDESLANKSRVVKLGRALF